METQELLALVEAEIRRRVVGGGAEEFSEGGQRFKLTTLKDLRELRAELREELAAGRGGFRLAEFDPNL